MAVKLAVPIEQQLIGADFNQPPFGFSAKQLFFEPGKLTFQTCIFTFQIGITKLLGNIVWRDLMIPD